MNFDFTENTVINIPLTYRGYRLSDGEKIRFRCLFKNSEGDFPYTLDVEEDNKGEEGADGKYTLTLDMGRYAICPGRYDFDMSLVLESGSLVTIMSKNDNHINVVPAAEGLYKPNGEIFFGADYIVESGEKDGWTYLKWASGLAECWCRREIQTDISTDWDGSGVLVSETIPSEPMSFPFEFESVPVITASAEGEHSVFLINGASGGTETTPGSFHLARPIKSINISFTLNICAKGRWK